jgi:hypothetical protein
MNAKGNAGTRAGVAGAGSDLHDDSDAHRKCGRREVQGIATARNPSQPAPVWPKPAGADAADAVAHALAGWSALSGQSPRDPRGKP